MPRGTIYFYLMSIIVLTVATLRYFIYQGWTLLFFISTVYINLFLYLEHLDIQMLYSFMFEFMFRRWLFRYDYQIVQEIHRHESDPVGIGWIDIGNQLTEKMKECTLLLCYQRRSHTTGFAFNSPGYLVVLHYITRSGCTPKVLGCLKR